MEYYDLQEFNELFDLNISNDDVYNDEFNCMGFALGTYEWDQIEDYGYNPYFDDEPEFAEEEVLDLAIGDVCELSDYGYIIDLDEREPIAVHYPHIRYMGIYNKNEKDFVEKLNPNEYLVAMRLAEDDFHFARRMENGSWYHKPGYTAIRKMEETELSDASNWCNRYYGDIAMFAITPALNSIGERAN